jgi:putative glycosyltransferase (TIGR04372 family)
MPLLTPIDPSLPPGPMRHRLARLGTRTWLATAPDTHSLGNAVLNVAWSFFMARHVRAPLCFEPLDRSRFPELWRLGCDGVEQVLASKNTALGHVFGAAAWLAPVLGWTGVVTSADGPAGAGDDAGGASLRRMGFGLDFRRLFAEQPLDVRLHGDDEERVAVQAAALGLADDRPIVTLHVREDGYKGAADREKDMVRSASLQTYLPALDWLVSRGYTVVRIGDPSMTPLQREGVVDLAAFPERSLGFDVHCIRRSAFFIATDSGPYNLSLLCNTPCLATNMTHVLGAYPTRARDRYIVRRVDDLVERRQLSLGEMLTPRHLKFRWDASKYRFHGNTPDDLLAGVQEMVQVVQGTWQPTSAQRAFRSAVSVFFESDYGRRKLKQASGSAAAPYFVGAGWASDASARAVLGHDSREDEGTSRSVVR